jgi:hypothetical protein
VLAIVYGIGGRARAIAVATSVAVAGYLIQNLPGLTDNLRPWRVLSPWHWFTFAPRT